MSVRRPYPPVSPKYRNPDQPSETWSGRGKQPRWLVAQLRLGKRIEDFSIRVGTRGTSARRASAKTERDQRTSIQHAPCLPVRDLSRTDPALGECWVLPVLTSMPGSDRPPRYRLSLCLETSPFQPHQAGMPVTGPGRSRFPRIARKNSAGRTQSLHRFEHDRHLCPNVQVLVGRRQLLRRGPGLQCLARR